MSEWVSGLGGLLIVDDPECRTLAAELFPDMPPTSLPAADFVPPAPFEGSLFTVLEGLARAAVRPQADAAGPRPAPFPAIGLVVPAVWYPELAGDAPAASAPQEATQWVSKLSWARVPPQASAQSRRAGEGRAFEEPLGGSAVVEPLGGSAIVAGGANWAPAEPPTRASALAPDEPPAEPSAPPSSAGPAMPRAIVVTDHVNLVGSGPLTGRWPAGRARSFPSLTGIYQPAQVRPPESGPVYSLAVAGVADEERLSPFERRQMLRCGLAAASSRLVPPVVIAAYYGLLVAAVAAPHLGSSNA